MSNSDIIIVNNIKYIIKNKNDIIQKTLLNGNQWNNNIVLIIGSLIKKYNLKHFVNIGSHIGTIALPISKYITKVTAVEPFPPNYQHFLEHLKLNNVTNIESFNYAMGNKEEKVFFLDLKNERFRNNSGGMHVVTDDDIKKNRLSASLHSKKYSNTIKKFDNLSISKFDIILIDVEGREYEMLKGGEKKISKNRPIIIIEIWDNLKRKKENLETSQEEVFNYIISLGYKLLNKSSNDHTFIPEDLKI